jgi:hypothetical protein
MNKRRLCFGCFLVLCLSWPVFSLSLGVLVDPENQPALLRGESLSRVQYNGTKPLLIPRDAYIQEVVGDMIKGLGPSFLAETLCLYRKPEGASPSRWSASERAALYNQTLALSSLAGLWYYSPSRKKDRIFYETSSVVSGPDGKAFRADPSYADPPGELTVYARQKDLSFGDNIYKYDYHARQDSLIFVQENLSAMNYGLVPAVGKNKLRSLVAVFDAGEFLVVYAASMAKTAALPGMGERVGRSFTARIDAILSWFSDRADKAFAKDR